MKAFLIPLLLMSLYIRGEEFGPCFPLNATQEQADGTHVWNNVDGIQIRGGDAATGILILSFVLQK